MGQAHCMYACGKTSPLYIRARTVSSRLQKLERDGDGPAPAAVAVTVPMRG
jgi:hypothetical protein